MSIAMETKLYTLPEFAKRYQLSDVYGASVACFDSNQDSLDSLERGSLSANFYSIILMIYGSADYSINGHAVHAEMHDMLVLPPYAVLRYLGCNSRAAGAHLLVEASYFEQILAIDEQLRGTIPIDIFLSVPLFSLDEVKAAELYQHYEQLRKAIHQPHIYKGEMVKYLVHIMQLFLAEQLYGGTVSTHDLKHKENIFKIFIYLASQNYRSERQVKFYADKLNITSTYLSRTVREISGNTVYGYLSGFLYNEACKLLKTTSKTVGEIADELSFNDQSAFTNFFKQKSGMSPLAYRAKK